MIVNFKNSYLEMLYLGEQPKGKPKHPQPVINKFISRVETIKQLDNAEGLANFKSLNFERLKGDKKHLYSIRINDQYRLVFELDNEVLKLSEIVTIEELSNHYK